MGLVKRFGLDSIDLLFDRSDFLSGGGGNPILLGWAVSLSGTKCRCDRDQYNHSHSCQTEVAHIHRLSLVAGKPFLLVLLLRLR
jgi:hypothetical protein